MDVATHLHAKSASPSMTSMAIVVDAKPGAPKLVHTLCFFEIVTLDRRGSHPV